jgi:hypothetical protein
MNNAAVLGKSLTDQALASYFKGDDNSKVEIIGFGSLLSKMSSLTTFPDLVDFRVVRVVGYRRVFRHPASVFFERGIASMDDLRISSLSCEKCEGSQFLGVVFSVASGQSGTAFQAREEEFDFHLVTYESYGPNIPGVEHITAGGRALMCVSSTNDAYIARWGHDQYTQKYLSLGLGDRGIWSWEEDSGILPCSVYLRHCYLSAKHLSVALGTDDILDSFLDDTYLVDRKTSLRTYLTANPDVLNTQPPENLVGRYSG